jgi:hypothetical protein
MQNTTLTCHTFDNLNMNWRSSTKPVLINLWAALFAWIWYEAYQWMISSFKLAQASIAVVGNSLSESGVCRLRTQRGLLCKCELIRIYIYLGEDQWWLNVIFSWENKGCFWRSDKKSPIKFITSHSNRFHLMNQRLLSNADAGIFSRNTVTF